MAPRREFAVLFDYRCPFARIAHEHVLEGVEEGAEWDVHFQAFSLSAAKQPTWDRAQDTGLLALELAVAVRDTQPDRFLAAHRALFTYRHDRGGNLRDVEAMGAVLEPARAVVGWDICAFNDDSFSFGEHAARALGRTGEVTVRPIDRQTYYAGTFHDPQGTP